MERMTNLRLLAFPGERGREGCLPSHFLMRKLFNGSHTYHSVSESVENKTKIKEATEHVMVLRDGEAHTEMLMQCSDYFRLRRWHRFGSWTIPKTKCKTFKNLSNAGWDGIWIVKYCTKKIGSKSLSDTLAIFYKISWFSEKLHPT